MYHVVKQQKHRYEDVELDDNLLTDKIKTYSLFVQRCFVQIMQKAKNYPINKKVMEVYILKNFDERRRTLLNIPRRIQNYLKQIKEDDKEFWGRMLVEHYLFVCKLNRFKGYERTQYLKTFTEPFKNKDSDLYYYFLYQLQEKEQIIGKRRTRVVPKTIMVLKPVKFVCSRFRT